MVSTSYDFLAFVNNSLACCFLNGPYFFICLCPVLVRHNGTEVDQAYFFH